MSFTRWLLLLAAGFGGGLAGSVAGLASVVSYPALLAFGLSPIAANVTNTVALVGSGAGAFLGSKNELVGQGALLRRLGPVGVLGGLVGSVLLLVTPRDTFRFVVPELIGTASLAILIRAGAHRPAGHDGSTHPPRSTLPIVTFAIAIYGGYFGAAAGVLMLAVLLEITGESVARSNAVKNVVLWLANGVAALVFTFFAPVHWFAALPLAIGFLAGGRTGPGVVRRVPPRPLRIAIALAGLALAVHLGYDAFG
jgi:uncharacterized membrane protein YfcA